MDESTDQTGDDTCRTPARGADGEMGCDNCGSVMRWETSHSRCDRCGYIRPCCEGAPLEARPASVPGAR